MRSLVTNKRKLYGDGVVAGAGVQEVCNGSAYGASFDTSVEPGQYGI